MLPPTISTTPNSPTVWAKPNSVAVSSAGFDSGSTTLMKRSNGEARSVAAASSTASSIAAKPDCNGCTTNGSEYSTEASSSPGKVNASVPSPSAVVSWPIGPSGPIPSSR